jgi:DNA-binding response OmpR family regulator
MPSAKQVHILLIEDNSGDVLLIRQILSGAGFPVRITTALDGEQAARMLADPQLKPDLIILDLNIPKISGVVLLGQFKPSAPVVVFSSSRNPEEMNLAMELGAREFIQKPLEVDEFANSIIKIVQDWASPNRRACGEP